MSAQPNSNTLKALTGATLIDGTGKPPLKNSTIIIEKNKIIQVGTKTNIKIPEKAQKIDLTGKTITPGFIDSHYHYFPMSIIPKMLSLNKTQSHQETLTQVQNKSKEKQPNEWITGYGWDDSKWSENRPITTDDLNQAAPNNPTGLIRVDGHTIAFNTLAIQEMEKTGIQVYSEVGDASLNNMENILNFFKLTLRDTTIDEFAEGLIQFAPYFFSHGCTSIHDPGLDVLGLRVYQRSREIGAVMPRSYVMVMKNAVEAASELNILKDIGDDFLKIGPVKFWIDGTLGSRSAALLEPYSDDADNYGKLFLESYRDDCSKIQKMNKQISTHAIGDKTIIKVLDTLESILNDYPREDHRHRIEHCEMLSEDQIQRIRNLDIVTAMQPNFVGAWCILQPMYQQRIGENRMRWCNPYRRLIDAGVVVAFGSDGMPFGPMFGVWSAVNHPIVESRISLVEAVKCHTLNCAYAAFMEDKVGSIEAGKLADIAVYDGDLTLIPSSDLLNVECVMTFLDGKVVYMK